ncbi:MAG: 3-hydroxyacyl-ACP dehydratase FabZ [Holosporales bacterium]|jgi:3-hydroxyacyl-[acyl-carrier-protein] dehydratase|nr:3-hydroxyacyl-ACP dehydratase FabZ [Holosporales bacterium]
MSFPEVLGLKEIKEIIPHRFPFLLLDRVEQMRPGDSCEAFKNVSVNEWYFQGHFPDYPVMPGVLVIEAMAQAAGVLAFATLIEEGVAAKGTLTSVYFMSINNAKFKHPIVPGDVMRIHISVEQRRGTKFWKFLGKTYVADTLTDEAEFTAMIPER